MWITGTGGKYLFTAGDKAWKTRRLLRNSSVKVRVCNMRGQAMPSATSYVGTGTVSSSADVVAGVERALAAKYGWQFKTTQFADWLRDRFSRGNRQEPVAVQLSLEVG